MKPPTSNWIHLLWTLPAAGAGFTAVLLLAPGSEIPACETYTGKNSPSAKSCNPASTLVQPPALEPGLVSDTRITLATGDTALASDRFSDRQIRLLNDMMPMPESVDELLAEIDLLSAQQRRFERRYGQDSVAARSVRDRLRDLHREAASGSQFAVQVERGRVDD